MFPALTVFVFLYNFKASTLREIKEHTNKSKKEVKLIMIGLDNAGKTTILKNIANEPIKSINPTKGLNVKEIQKDN